MHARRGGPRGDPQGVLAQPTCHMYADSSNCASGTIAENGVDNCDKNGNCESFEGAPNDALHWYTCKSKPCATQASLPDSLVGYWPLDGNGADVSGHGLAAQDQNGEWVAGGFPSDESPRQCGEAALTWRISCASLPP